MHTGLLLFSLLVVSANSLDPQWKLLWSDEFTGNIVDDSKWTIRDQAGYSSNGEIGWYAYDQVSVSNGTLILTSNPDSTHGAGFPYATGFLDTAGKFSTTYGRFEINAKLPAGKGLWAVQWLGSEYLCWPYGAEIDILENINNPISQIHGTYHFGAACNDDHANASMYDTGLDLSQGFHTYALEWNASSVTWFFDDVAYKTVYSATVNQGQNWTFDATPHFITLNTAVGGYWPGDPDNTTVWPQYNIIDYVRVYVWDPCNTGCVHGCCENATRLCSCNPGAYGSFCEYTGDIVQSQFAAVTGNDIFINNAAIANVGGGNQLVLTIVNSSCPDACTGGRWETLDGYGYGNYTFVVKGTNVAGTALLLWGWTNTGTFTGFEAGLSGGAPTTLFFQAFGENANFSSWQSYSLGFDASLTYHTYTISYGEGFKVFVDGHLLLTTLRGPYVPLQLAIEYYYNLDYYNGNQPFTGTLPVSTYAAAVSFTPVSGAPTVCNLVETTTTAAATTTTATTAATTAAATTAAATTAAATTATTAAATTTTTTAAATTAKPATTTTTTTKPATATTATTAPSTSSTTLEPSTATTVTAIGVATFVATAVAILIQC